MSLDSFSYSSPQTSPVPRPGQMPREHMESKRDNEINNDTQKLLAEAYIFLDKSRLFGKNPTIAEPIRARLEQAKNTNDITVLEHIIETLKDEKRFILDYARRFANESDQNISIYELQGQLQNAYIDKIVYEPERREQVDPNTALKQLYAGYQLT